MSYKSNVLTIYLLCVYLLTFAFGVFAATPLINNF